MLALKSKIYNPTFQSQVYMDRMFFYIIGNSDFCWNNE